MTVALNTLSGIVIGTAIELHRSIGPGLLESAYEASLAYDLREQGLQVDRQVAMPFVYKGVSLDIGYRLDLLVENELIIELKSVEALRPVHYAQVLTYLRLSELRLGLLINFNTRLLKDGVHRIINGY